MNPLNQISYGLYILTSKNENKFNGQIANAVVQVTSEPPAISVCVNKKNLTHKFIETSKLFNLSILSKDVPLSLVALFGFKSGNKIDKFENISFVIGKNGVPIIEDYATSSIELTLIDSLDVGTHTVFVGKVTNSNVISDKKPITYDYYREVKKGKVSKNAPHFIKEKKEKKGKIKMDTYVCNICGYVYDPSIGDPDNNVSAGTKFEDLPEDWICPTCDAEQSEFSKE